MINLSDRLKMMADMANPGESVADIGTDHGYLPIYLMDKGVTPFAVLTDISGGSLNKAKANCKEMLSPECNYSLREGDGLDPLEPAEVDVVFIAGMGGLLITEILEWDIGKSRSYKRFVLQPRNNGGELRKYLEKRGFKVDNYFIVPEGNRYSEIMVVHSEEKESSVPVDFRSEEEYDYPDMILKSGEFVRAYLEASLMNESTILNKIREGASESSGKHAEEDITRRQTRIKRIESLLGRI